MIHQVRRYVNKQTMSNKHLTMGTEILESIVGKQVKCCNQRLGLNVGHMILYIMIKMRIHAHLNALKSGLSRGPFGLRCT
jgi:hypothetical protein